MCPHCGTAFTCVQTRHGRFQSSTPVKAVANGAPNNVKFFTDEMSASRPIVSYRFNTLEHSSLRILPYH